MLKSDGKETTCCFTVAFDYDEWQYTINNTENKELPPGVKTITVEVEHGYLMNPATSSWDFFNFRELPDTIRR